MYFLRKVEYSKYQDVLRPKDVVENSQWDECVYRLIKKSSFMQVTYARSF